MQRRRQQADTTQQATAQRSRQVRTWCDRQSVEMNQSATGCCARYSEGSPSQAVSAQGNHKGQPQREAGQQMSKGQQQPGPGKVEGCALHSHSCTSQWRNMQQRD